MTMRPRPPDYNHFAVSDDRGIGYLPHLREISSCMARNLDVSSGLFESHS